MKTGLLWSLIIAAAPSYSFAAEVIDCDELAQYVQTKIPTLYPFAAIGKDGAMRITYSASRMVSDGSKAERKEYYEENEDCKSSRSSMLISSSYQLERYNAALMRCVRTSAEPYPYAKEILWTLHRQKILNSRCRDIYTQSVEGHKEQRWSAEHLEAERQARHRKVLDAYIDDSKR